MAGAAVPKSWQAFGVGALLGPLLGGFLLYLQVQGLRNLQRRVWLLLAFAGFSLGALWMADAQQGWFGLFGFMAGGLLTWAVSWVFRWRAFIAGWAWGTLFWFLLYLIWAWFFS